MRVRLGWVTALASGVLLALFVVVNVLLNTRVLPHVIIGDDPNFAMSWRFAYSLWPTRLHVYDFRLTGQDPNIQLEYDQARADLTLDLSSLLHRTFRATSVRGVGARFLLRERLVPVDVDPESAAVLPPIAKFSDPPLRFVGPVEAPTPIADLENELTARFEDVDVTVTELWVDGFRFRGKGEATGSFHIKPQLDVAVDGHFALDSGAVTRGALPVVGDLAGALAVFVHQFNPQIHQGKDAVHSVDCSIHVWGSLADLQVLTPYFGGEPLPRFSSAPGSFEVLGQFEGGRLVPNTWVRLQSDLLALSSGPYQFKGPFEATAQVGQGAGASPMVVGRVALGPSRLLRGDLAAPLIQVGLIELGVTSATLDLLDQPFGDLGLWARLEGGEAPDLGLAREYFPESKLLAIRSGSARFNAALDSPFVGPGVAEANFAAENLDVVVGPLDLQGDLLLGATLRGVTAQSRLTALLGPNPFAANASLVGHLAVRPLGARRSITASGHPLLLVAEGRLAPFLPGQADVRYLLDRLSGRARLDADLSGLGFLNGWSKRPAGWSFEGGTGSIVLDARVGAGRLTEGSSLHARLKDWAVAKDEVRAQGSLQLNGSVGRNEGKGGGLQATLSVAPYTIEMQGTRTLLVRGTRLEVVAQSPSLALRSLAKTLGVSSEAQAEAPDLALFNQFMGPGGEFGIAGGSGQIIASMKAQRGGAAEGEVEISGKRIGVDLSGSRLVADWNARTHLQQTRVPGGAIALSGGSIRLDGVAMDGTTEGWWSHVAAEGELVLTGDKHLRLRFSLQARDIAPILTLYGSRFGLSGWLQPHLSMNGFEASGNLQVGSHQFAIEDFRGTGRQLEVLGQFKLQSGASWGDVVIDSGPLALGFEVRNQDTALKWFNARGWYEGRVREGLQQERPLPAPAATKATQAPITTTSN